MDQWRQQRLRQPWCEGQVTATFLPGAVSCHGGLRWAVGGGWDGVAFLGSSLRSFAASRRFHPQSYRWISGHHQPWADGRALWSRQPGLRGQQLHQCCQSSPEHRLRPQPRGECSLLGSAQGEEDGEWQSQGKGLHLHVVMEVSSSGQSPFSPQPAFWLRNSTRCSICHATAEPQATNGWCRMQQFTWSPHPWAPLALPGHHSRSWSPDFSLIWPRLSKRP